MEEARDFDTEEHSRNYSIIWHRCWYGFFCEINDGTSLELTIIWLSPRVELKLMHKKMAGEFGANYEVYHP